MQENLLAYHYFRDVIWGSVMATVLIRFNGGNVPVLVGAAPSTPDEPIANPTDTGGTANTPFIMAAGTHCFALQSPTPYRPLWQIGEAIDGTQLRLDFAVVP
jgi:hypothetical protein